MGKKAMDLADAGDFLGAANELARIARSMFQSDVGDFTDNLQAWLQDGAPPNDSRFKAIVSDARQALHKAIITRRTAQGF